MKLSDLWPRAGAGKPATPVVSVKVAKRAAAEQPLATGNTPTPSTTQRGPVELPATLAECELLEEELCRDSIRLECQLGIAKGKSQAGGEYADPTWYHKASAALKHIRRDRQRLAVHMKKLRIEARRADPHWQSRDQALIRALREELPGGRFEQIVEEVELNIQAGISQ